MSGNTSYIQIGWAARNGSAGEIIFRQAGHPANDEAINTASALRWEPIYVARERP